MVVEIHCRNSDCTYASILGSVPCVFCRHRETKRLLDEARAKLADAEAECEQLMDRLRHNLDEARAKLAEVCRQHGHVQIDAKGGVCSRCGAELPPGPPEPPWTKAMLEARFNAKLAEVERERDAERAHRVKLGEMCDDLTACSDDCDLRALLSWFLPGELESIRAARSKREEAAKTRIAHLEAKLARAVEAWHLVDKYVGCGDNSCMFKKAEDGKKLASALPPLDALLPKPSGMATNGGCRCVERGGGRPGVAASLAKLYKALADISKPG